MEDNMTLETIPISKFKATCLGLLKQVKRKGEPILITLKGEPVGMVVPPPAAEKSGTWIGAFRTTGRIVGDIVTPAADESEWEVLQKARLCLTPTRHRGCGPFSPDCLFTKPA
jgi:prevent-host-death family protein